MEADPSPARAGTWPTLGYRDARAAIRFLVDAFGFVTGPIHEGPNEGSVAHAEVLWPEGGGVMIHTAGSPASVATLSADFRPSGPYPPFAIHVDTRDPDTVYARARDAGATIVRPLADSPLGPRGFVARDPEGLFWSFGTPLSGSASDLDADTATTLFIIARFRARPGREEALAETITDVLAPTRREAGCRYIQAVRSTRDPRLFFIQSRWRDEAAFDEHAGLPHTVRFLERVEPLIDHPLDVCRTTRIG